MATTTFEVGDTVAWPAAAPEGVDPFTTLEVTSLNSDGTVEVRVSHGPRAGSTFRADPSELVHAA